MKKQKIFVIGSNKTGTTSLTKSFKTLGYNVCPEHLIFNPKSKYLIGFFNENYEELFKLVSIYDAFQDRPWNHIDFYQKLDAQFPNSKFILTIRDTDNWVESYKRWSKKINLQQLWFYREVSKVCYGIDDFLSDTSLMKKKYEERNLQIIDYFNNNDNFLIMDLEKGDGWEKLCHFTNDKIPDIPFPHENKTK